MRNLIRKVNGSRFNVVDVLFWGLVAIGLACLVSVRAEGQEITQTPNLLEIPNPLPVHRSEWPAAFAGMSALMLEGQVTNPVTSLPPDTTPTGIFGWLKGSGILSASNYAVEPYGSYMPSAPKGTRFGGGILAFYNLNDFVAPGIGVDWLGQFSLVSATLTLKAPIPLSSFGGFLGGWTTNVVVTPFALVEAGMPIGGSGGSSGITTTATAGGYLEFGHIFGGRFNVGGAYGRRDNAGLYSGTLYNFFAGLNWHY
jgi:hypothetical protein